MDSDDESELVSASFASKSSTSDHWFASRYSVVAVPNSSEERIQDSNERSFGITPHKPEETTTERRQQKPQTAEVIYDRVMVGLSTPHDDGPSRSSPLNSNPWCATSKGKSIARVHAARIDVGMKGKTAYRNIFMERKML